jgi:hypothetical protein
MFALGDNQKVTLTVVGTDEMGNPSVTPPGPFTWVIEDPALLELDEVSEDTRTAVVAAVGPLGKTNVVVWDGKLQGIGEISIVATEPVKLDLVPGMPTLVSSE